MRTGGKGNGDAVNDTGVRLHSDRWSLELVG